MPSTTEDLARTRIATWVRTAPQAHQADWDVRMLCFGALGDILAACPGRRQVADRLSQPAVSPPGLLTRVARVAHLTPASVYSHWSAAPGNRAIRRLAGADQAVRPREAFVAEAKIVSFWPYRSGALAVADRFEMSLTEVAASYLRALGAWASDNPLLAACVPVGPPSCVAEDMGVIAARRSARRPAGAAPADAAASRLATLAAQIVAAVLGDASITPLGAFNVVRDEALQLLRDPPDPVAVRVSDALSELADRLLYHGDGEPALTAGQVRQLRAELTGLSALLGDIAPDGAELAGGERGQEAGR